MHISILFFQTKIKRDRKNMNCVTGIWGGFERGYRKGKQDLNISIRNLIRMWTTDSLIIRSQNTHVYGLRMDYKYHKRVLRAIKQAESGGHFWQSQQEGAEKVVHQMVSSSISWIMPQKQESEEHKGMKWYTIPVLAKYNKAWLRVKLLYFTECYYCN